MGPIFVDSGYLIALSDPDDQHHDDSIDWVEILEDEGRRLVTTEFCLIELVNHLSAMDKRHLGRQVVRDLQTHRDFDVIQCSSSLVERGLQLHAERDDKTWGLTDCISLVVMQDQSIHDVLAYDSDFDEAGKRVLTAE